MVVAHSEEASKAQDGVCDFENGIATLWSRWRGSARPIARGTLPLSVFGSENYGYRLGLLGAPFRICQARASLGFGILIGIMGGGVLIVSSALSIAALLALVFPSRQKKGAATAKATVPQPISSS